MSLLNTSFKGKNVFISGASRGIVSPKPSRLERSTESAQGLGIVLALARDGANIAIAAKTGESTPRGLEIRLQILIYRASNTTSQIAWDNLHCCGRNQQSWGQRTSYRM
jgi:NAD(P)-dependent dehydrogenase (short-subunit alcohol dehydrogenase family)